MIKRYIILLMLMLFLGTICTAEIFIGNKNLFWLFGILLTASLPFNILFFKRLEENKNRISEKRRGFLINLTYRLESLCDPLIDLSVDFDINTKNYSDSFSLKDSLVFVSSLMDDKDYIKKLKNDKDFNKLLKRMENFYKDYKSALDNINKVKEPLITEGVFNNQEIEYFQELVLNGDADKVDKVKNVFSWLSNDKHIFVELKKILKRTYSKTYIKFEKSVNPYNDNYMIVNGGFYQIPNREANLEGRTEFRRVYHNYTRPISINNIQRSGIVEAILNEGFPNCIDIYEKHVNYLGDINFIFNDENEGFDYYNPIKERNLGEYDVNTFFESDKLIFLNQRYYILTAAHLNPNIKIENLISLDTNIISDIYKKYKSPNSHIGNDLNKIINLFTEDRKWGVDFLPYFYENCLFEPSKVDSEIYYDNVLVFERLFNKTEKEALNYTEDLINYYKMVLKSEQSLYIKSKYRLIYLALLLMAEIQFTKKFLKSDKKTNIMLDYFHNVIGIIPEREIVLSKIYFEKRNKYKFFGKIQKGHYDILGVLKNIAWDIFHIHYAIEQHSLQSDKDIDFTISTLITQDKELKKIIEFYKVKSMAFIPGTNYRWINYSYNNLSNKSREKYFSPKSYHERIKKIKSYNEKTLLDKINEEIKIIEQRFSGGN